MPYRQLADFLEELGRAGELARVDANVSPVVEIAEATRRAARESGPALLFATAGGHDAPVLTNLFGTERRVCRAMEVDGPAEGADKVDRLLRSTGSEGWFERLRAGGHVGPLASLAPRRVKSGACQQIVRLGGDVNLEELPLLQADAGEAGPTIASAVAVSAEPDSHAQTAGRYDFQWLGRDRLAACWADQDEPARLLTEYGRRGGRMPVALVLGGDPVFLLAAAAPVPSAVDPLGLAGLLRDKPLDAVACRTIDLSIPAEADIVVEGYVDPAEPPVPAGPRSTAYGQLSPPRPAAVLHVTAVTHRANRIYVATVPGPVPCESAVVTRTMARVFLPLLRLTIPELVDFDLPLSGEGRHWAVLAIRKTYAGQSRRVASIAWGLRPFLAAKFLVVVDEGLDVRDWPQVTQAMAAHAEPGRDLFFYEDPDGGRLVGIDATRKGNTVNFPFSGCRSNQG